MTGRKLERCTSKRFVGLRVLGALPGDEGGVALVDVAVDEVADDFDGAGDAEGGFRAVFEVGGDRGDAVRALDAVAGDGEVGAVEADEGDIGAVEGGDEGQADAAAGEHVAGEQRGDGVGDGVVDVEEIEGVELGDLGHAGGEGEVVGWVLEERVVGDRDLVVEWMPRSRPERRNGWE